MRDARPVFWDRKPLAWGAPRHRQIRKKLKVGGIFSAGLEGF
jgi:hypothetical protein